MSCRSASVCGSTVDVQYKTKSKDYLKDLGLLLWLTMANLPQL